MIGCNEKMRLTVLPMFNMLWLTILKGGKSEFFASLPPLPSVVNPGHNNNMLRVTSASLRACKGATQLLFFNIFKMFM